MTNPKRASLSAAASGGSRARAAGRRGAGGAVRRDADAESSEEADREPDSEPDVELIADAPADEAGGASREASPEILSDPGELAAEVLPPDGETRITRRVPADGASGRRPGRDPVARLMAEVRRYPRLSEEDERTLGKAVREHGDVEAARRLVVHNLRLVVAIAHQYRRAWANILDLFQEGSVGLMEAVKRWEPTLGPRFGTYAAYWIRAYVLKFLMTNSRLVHVGNTRAGRKLFFRLERERQKLIAHGFEPTAKLLAARLDVDEQDVAEVGRHLDSREVSFDPMPGTRGAEAEDGYGLSERIPLSQASPEENAATQEMSDNLRQVMDDFFASLTDEREQAIWRDHLAASEPTPLGEIGARFGVSKQRMGQIADALKKRFRERIVAKMGPNIRTDWLGGQD